MANIPKLVNLQIELTKGCTYNCDFCGASSIKDAPVYMSIATANIIADKCKDLRKIHLSFAMRGEPLLNSNWETIIQIFRNKNKKIPIFLSSNSAAIKTDTLDKFFNAGGNVFIYNVYDDTKYDSELLKLSGYDIVEAYTEKEDQLYIDLLHPPELVNFHNSDFADCNIQKILFKKHPKEDYVHSCAGSIKNKAKYNVKLDPGIGYCAGPQAHLAIHYNGAIAFCSMPWDNSAIIGNINTDEIMDIWLYNELLQDLRLKLNQNRRTEIPSCAKCNYTVKWIRNNGI